MVSVVVKQYWTRFRPWAEPVLALHKLLTRVTDLYMQTLRRWHNLPQWCHRPIRPKGLTARPRQPGRLGTPLEDVLHPTKMHSSEHHQMPDGSPITIPAPRPHPEYRNGGKIPWSQDHRRPPLGCPHHRCLQWSQQDLGLPQAKHQNYKWKT